MSHETKNPETAASPSMPQKPRTWCQVIRRKSFAMLFGLGLALVLAELALRIIGYSSPAFLRTHPIFGSAFKAGIEGWFRLEGKAWNSINSHGFNGPEWTTVKPANTFRIVVLGDSYTAAQQVAQSESFCQQLRKQLQASGKLVGRKIEVLNCGCSGYGTAQELLVWREQARHFQPDIVLLAFLPGNDVNDNYRPLTIELAIRPYMTLGADDKLKLDDRFLQDEEFTSRQTWTYQVQYFLMEYSRLAQLINTIRLNRANNEQVESKPATPQPAKAEIGLSDQAFQKPAGEWIAGWKITARLIQQLQREVLAEGAKFGVVCLTSGAQTDPDPKIRAHFAATLGVPDLLQPEREVARICETAEPPIPLLTLAPEFQRLATEQQISFHGFGQNLNGGHWNEAGHRYAGKLIAEWLESKPELLRP